MGWDRFGKRLKHLLRAAAVGGAALYMLFLAYALWRRHVPVLFHIDGDCVCTDYSPEVEGYTIFNPFRNRAPERSADSFLQDLSEGKCQPRDATPQLAAEVCKDGTFPPFKWRLEHRVDEPHKTHLYFAFRQLGPGAPPDYSGEGTVVLVESRDGWKADSMDGLGLW